MEINADIVDFKYIPKMHNETAFNYLKSYSVCYILMSNFLGGGFL